MKIYFIFPPLWECDSPYISIPTLAAFLRKQGHDVSAIDLNIKIQNKILDTEELKRTVKYLRELLDSESDEMKRNHIQEVLALTELLDFSVFDQAKKVLKTKKDIKEVVWAKKILEIGRYIYSAQFFPAHFFSNEYAINGKTINTISTLMDIAHQTTTNIFGDYLRQYAEKIANKFDLIGISVASTNQLVAALTLASQIKQKNHSAKICLGGAVLPYMRESICNSPDLFEWFDYIIVGEGETALLKLLEYLEGKCDIETIPNILYVQNGKVLQSQNEVCEKIQMLPVIDYRYIEWEDYFSKERVISYLASRGCYWNKCSFCGLTSNYGQKYRVKNIEQIVTELGKLSCTNQCNHIVFNDEALTAYEIKAISKEILKRGLRIYWSCLCRLDKQHTKEIFQLAYKAGLRIISFGLENGSQKVLNLMNKGIDLHVAQRIIKDSSDAGIWNNIYLMLGFPGEVEEDIQCTKTFLEENQDYIDTLGYGEFRLDGYSKVFKSPEEYGIQVESYSKDYFGPDYHFNYNTGDNRKQITQFEKYLLRFKFNPAYFIGIDLNLLLVNLAHNDKKYIKETINEATPHMKAADLVNNKRLSDLYVKSYVENYKCINRGNAKIYLFYSSISGMSIQLIGDLDIFLDRAKKGVQLQEVVEMYLKKYKDACDHYVVEDFLKKVVLNLNRIGVLSIEERV